MNCGYLVCLQTAPRLGLSLTSFIISLFTFDSCCRDYWLTPQILFDCRLIATLVSLVATSILIFHWFVVLVHCLPWYSPCLQADLFKLINLLFSPCWSSAVSPSPAPPSLTLPPSPSSLHSHPLPPSHSSLPLPPSLSLFLSPPPSVFSLSPSSLLSSLSSSTLYYFPSLLSLSFSLSSALYLTPSIFLSLSISLYLPATIFLPILLPPFSPSSSPL